MDCPARGMILLCLRWAPLHERSTPRTARVMAVGGGASEDRAAAGLRAMLGYVRWGSVTAATLPHGWTWSSWDETQLGVSGQLARNPFLTPMQSVDCFDVKREEQHQHQSLNAQPMNHPIHWMQPAQSPSTGTSEEDS